MIQFSIGLPSFFTPILTLIFGILVLVFPKLLRWMIGLYLVILGLVGIISIV